MSCMGLFLFVFLPLFLLTPLPRQMLCFSFPELLRGYGKTKREVKEKLKEAQRAIEQGSFITERDQTLETYLHYWLQMRRDSLTIKVSTYASYKSYLRRHVLPALGSITIQKLTGGLIQSLYFQLKQEGLSPNTIHLVHTILNAALNDAVKWRKIPFNPCKDLTPPKLQKKEMKYLSQEEAIQLLEAARGYRVETLLLLAVTLGLRRGELLGLQWDDIDFRKGSLQVKRTIAYVPLEDGTRHTYIATDPKTERSKRTIVLPQFVLDALKEHKNRQAQERSQAGKRWQHSNLVFANQQGGYFSLNLLRGQFKKVLEKAGLKDMRFHDLRHSAATILLSMGINIKVIQELLGHTNVNITLGTYSHVTPTMQRDAMSALNDRFQNSNKERRSMSNTHTKRSLHSLLARL